MSFIALEMFNAAVSPEDEDDEKRYDKIPKWVKEHNLILMNPWAEGDDDPVALKIPLPYGYNVFAVLGYKIGEVIRGKTDPIEAAADVGMAAVNSFNPLGGSDEILPTLVPTVLKPGFEIMANKNFAGAPIRPEQPPYGVEKPDSQLYWNGVSTASKEFARILNELTGGNEVRPGAIDISPETLDHFFAFVTGGAGMFVERSSDFVVKWARGDKIPWRGVPMVRRVIEGQNEYYDRTRYYEIRAAAGTADAEQKMFLDAGRADAAKKAAAAHRAELDIRGTIKGTDKALSALRKQRRAVQASKLSHRDKQDKIDEIDEKITGYMRRATARYNKLSKATTP